MKSLKRAVATRLVLFAGLLVSASEHERSVTAITEVSGDGQKPSALAIPYDAVVNGTRILVSDFPVDQRNVAKVYAITAVILAPESTAGKFVVPERANSTEGAIMGIQRAVQMMATTS